MTTYPFALSPVEVLRRGFTQSVVRDDKTRGFGIATQSDARDGSNE